MIIRASLKNKQGTGTGRELGPFLPSFLSLLTGYRDVYCSQVSKFPPSVCFMCDISLWIHMPLDSPITAALCLQVCVITFNFLFVICGFLEIWIHHSCLAFCPLSPSPQPRFRIFLKFLKLHVSWGEGWWGVGFVESAHSFYHVARRMHLYLHVFLPT